MSEAMSGIIFAWSWSTQKRHGSHKVGRPAKHPFSRMLATVSTPCCTVYREPESVQGRWVLFAWRPRVEENLGSGETGLNRTQSPRSRTWRWSCRFWLRDTSMCVFHSLFKYRYSPYTEFCRHRQAAGSLRFRVWVLQFKAPGLSVPGELVIRLLGWKFQVRPQMLCKAAGGMDKRCQQHEVIKTWSSDSKPKKALHQKP